MHKFHADRSLTDLVGPYAGITAEVLVGLHRERSPADQGCPGRNPALQLVAVAGWRLLSGRAIREPDAAFARWRQVPLGNGRRMCWIPIRLDIATIRVTVCDTSTKSHCAQGDRNPSGGRRTEHGSDSSEAAGAAKQAWVERPCPRELGRIVRRQPRSYAAAAERTKQQLIRLLLQPRQLAAGHRQKRIRPGSLDAETGDGPARAR